jgi:hypothetical protein
VKFNIWLDRKLFLEQTKEQEENIKKTLAKLPKTHQKLMDGFKIVWQCDNVLKGDKGHVGLVDTEKKTITLAAPFRWSSEHVLLHEIAHLIWNILVSKELKAKWAALMKKIKRPLDEKNDEELFCHAFASHFCFNPTEKFSDDRLMNMVQEIIKATS